MIDDVPCVIVQAVRRLLLVLRADAAISAALPRANIVLLVPGNAAFDFGWSCLGEVPGRGAGVAAAMAARLHGDILCEPVLRGLDIAARQGFDLAAPPDWWHGDWRIRRRGSAAAPARAYFVHARLLLHGEMILN